jgi:hypothetical protein
MVSAFGYRAYIAFWAFIGGIKGVIGAMNGKYY